MESLSGRPSVRMRLSGEPVLFHAGGFFISWFVFTLVLKVGYCISSFIFLSLNNIQVEIVLYCTQLYVHLF